MTASQFIEDEKRKRDIKEKNARMEYELEALRSKISQLESRLSLNAE